MRTKPFVLAVAFLSVVSVGLSVFSLNKAPEQRFGIDPVAITDTLGTLRTTVNEIIGSLIATSTTPTVGQLPYWTGAGSLGSVATSSVTIGSPLTSAGTPGYVVGGSGWTLDIDDIQAADLDLTDITLATFTDDVGFATFSYPFPSNATSTLLTFSQGLLSTASSTIGDGTQAGGLTISGGATTTNLAATSLTSAGVITNSIGQFAEYAGTSCTNQFVRSLSALIAATCAAVDLAADVTGTLPVGNGGTGATTLDNLITLATHTVGNFVATLTSSGSITVGNSGSENAAVTVNLNMGNANTWTALQTFANSSTTRASFDYASSTLYYGAGLADCNTGNMLTWTAGRFGCEADDVGGGGGTDGFDFSYSQDIGFGVTGSATSTKTLFSLGIHASSTSQFDNASTTKLSVGNQIYQSFGAFSVSYASTTQGVATSTSFVGPAPQAMTVNSVQCDFNNFMGVSLYDGTNRANYLVASSTIGTLTYSTNNAFTLAEPIRVDFGTSTDIVTDVRGSCTFKYRYTAD